MDPQGNLGFSLGLDIEDGYTVYEVLNGEVTIREAAEPADCCDVIPSNILLSEAELAFQRDNRELILKNALFEVEEDYDYIIIDTPPAFNILTLNAYAAADHLIIPMASEILSLVGLVQLKETVDAIRESVNPGLHVLGILLTRFNKRTNLSRDVLEMAQTIAEQTGSTVFDAKIRSGVAVAEAPAHGLCILHYAPRSGPAQDYQAFVDEALRKMEAYQQLTGRVRVHG